MTVLLVSNIWSWTKANPRRFVYKHILPELGLGTELYLDVFIVEISYISGVGALHLKNFYDNVVLKGLPVSCRSNSENCFSWWLILQADKMHSNIRSISLYNKLSLTLIEFVDD